METQQVFTINAFSPEKNEEKFDKLEVVLQGIGLSWMSPLGPLLSLSHIVEHALDATFVHRTLYVNRYSMSTTKVTIEATVNAPIEKVWQYWTGPEHITQWNAASDDWHTSHAENDPRTGGKFKSRMEAKDGSFGFDFEGVYDEVIQHKRIAYSMGDDRKVEITFTETPDGVKVTETFDAEGTNSVEMQRAGWQAILDNFRRYTERH